MQKEVTTSFEEIPPQELNEWFQKFYLSARKHDGCLVIAHQNYKCYELKNIIFARNYFTVLVYAKTIIFTEVEVASGGYLPHYFVAW